MTKKQSFKRSVLEFLDVIISSAEGFLSGILGIAG